MAQTQQNISSRSAYNRFMLGSMMTAFGTIRLMRDSKSKSGQLLVLLGSMSAAEGATKFCPRKAMNDSIRNSNMIQKMKSQNYHQDALAGSQTQKNNASQSGQGVSKGSNRQMSGNFMQMVGNIVQMFTGGNEPTYAQNKVGTQRMNSGAGQNSESSNNVQASGNSAQHMTSGATAQTNENKAKTFVSQVGQIMNDVASMTGAQTNGQTNKGGEQAARAIGASNTNGNNKNASSGTSNNQKNANANTGNEKSASTSSKTQDATSNEHNLSNELSTKTHLDGASNVDASVINATSKTAHKNESARNILQ